MITSINSISIFGMPVIGKSDKNNNPAFEGKGGNFKKTIKTTLPLSTAVLASYGFFIKDKNSHSSGKKAVKEEIQKIYGAFDIPDRLIEEYKSNFDVVRKLLALKNKYKAPMYSPDSIIGISSLYREADVLDRNHKKEYAQKLEELLKEDGDDYEKYATFPNFLELEHCLEINHPEIDRLYPGAPAQKAVVAEALLDTEFKNFDFAENLYHQNKNIGEPYSPQEIASIIKSHAESPKVVEYLALFPNFAFKELEIMHFVENSSVLADDFENNKQRMDKLISLLQEHSNRDEIDDAGLVKLFIKYKQYSEVFEELLPKGHSPAGLLNGIEKYEHMSRGVLEVIKVINKSKEPAKKQIL